jgi:hypothetical protein
MTIRVAETIDASSVNVISKVTFAGITYCTTQPIKLREPDGIDEDSLGTKSQSLLKGDSISNLLSS